MRRVATAQKVLRLAIGLAIGFAIGSAIVMGASLSGCTSEPTLDRGPLRPGDSWFDRVSDIQILAISPTNFPGDVPESAMQVLADRAGVILPSDWVHVRPKKLWVYAPTLNFDLDLGPRRVAYDGIRVAPVFQPASDDGEPRPVVRWTDRKRSLNVDWDSSRGLLRAHRVRPAFALEYGFSQHRNTVVSLIERPALLPGPGDKQGGAKGLICRASARDSGTDTRTVLYAPAASRYRLDASLLDADTLSFAVHTVKYGVTWNARKKQLLGSDRASGDGTTFAVEIWDGQKLVRVWSQHVTDKQGFVEAKADLRAYRGQPLRIELVTEGGPDNDTLYDYGVWSGLHFEGASEAVPERPHIFLIDVDTLRADRLSVYGYRRDTTPRLKKWADENALVYEHSAAASTWTLPSTASMLTGLSLTQHDVVEAGDALRPEHHAIAARLERAGYETRARVEGSYLNPVFGFDLGFERYDSHQYDWRETWERGWKEELATLRDRESDRPIFFFLQTYIPHVPHANDRRFEDPDRPPYEGRFSRDGGLTSKRLRGIVAEGGPLPDEGDWNYVNDVYDASVARMDDVAMGFIEGVEEVFADEPFLLIFTSDHGEEINDHGFFGHGHVLYEEVTRVPLIVRFPDRSRVGRSREPTSGLDLVPTILDFAGVAIPKQLSGLSLRNELPEDRVRISELKQEKGSYRMALWQRGNKTILAGPDGDEFFDLSRDPHERSNLAQHHAGEIAAQRDRLREYRETFPRIVRPRAKQRLSPALVEELKALGYVIDEQ